MKSVSVVIPTYNGKTLLAKNLPPLLHAAERHPFPVEVIVVDDASSDGSVQFVSENFPEVRVLAQEANSGFAETINRGIFAAGHDIILALNNDVLVDDNLFARALARFEDPAVFSVTPNMVDPRLGESQAITRLKPGICWFNTVNLQLRDLDGFQGEIPLFFASGGASFYDREKLCLLGGFDPVYHPFYVEDLDLSYRGWKAGWKCLMEPGTTVYHETSSSAACTGKEDQVLTSNCNSCFSAHYYGSVADHPLAAAFYHFPAL
jgi:GT2 family glycosyltransferase